MKLVASFWVQIILCTLCMAQPATVRVHLKDGSVRSFNVDSVSRATVTHVPGPHYNQLRLIRSGDEQPITDGWIYPKTRPTITFGRDDEGYRALRVGSSEYRILGPNRSDNPFEATVDRIMVYNYYRDTNVLSIDPDMKYGLFTAGVWLSDTLIVSPPLSLIKINPDFTLAASPRQLAIAPMTYSLDISRSRRRILTIRSAYVDNSYGRIVEYDIVSGAADTIDARNIFSRAVYDPQDESILYYYSYGSYVRGSNENPTDAGYYKWDRTTNKHELILQHISNLGPSEGINGFDIHPKERKLLLPLVSGTTRPLLVELDLESLVLDTLDIPFDISAGRVCLWASYNSDGSKLVFSNYPRNAFVFGYAQVGSATGIYSFASRETKVLSIVPDSFDEDWVVLFPEFVPGTESISFSASEIGLEPAGIVGEYRYYVMKNLP